MPPFRRPPPLLLQLLAQQRRANYSTAQKKLAKPTKYTPPSHPSSRPLRPEPVNYPGPPPPRDPETSQYPRMMPPKGTWAYYFLTSRNLHVVLSFTILFTLGCAAQLQNYVRTSPHAADMRWEWTHPLRSARRFFRLWLETIQFHSLEADRKHKDSIADVDKRAAYRKAHGLNEELSWTSWTLRKDRSDEALALAEETRENGVLQSAKSDEGEPWVDEELKKIEEEAARAAAAVEEAAGGVVAPEIAEVISEKEKTERKSWWKFW